VDRHEPAPEWFQDAKFGIYYHWGVFTTPMFANEWYPRNMYNRGDNSSEYRNHVDKYGDPFGDWPYHNFMEGANDKQGNWVQFAPRLTSEGGAWDPEEWAQLFVDAGARYAGPVAEHHDGMSLWDSDVNEWNAADKGPMLDLVGLQEQAFRARGLKFLMSMHHAFNITGFYDWAPDQSDPGLQKLYGKLAWPDAQQYWLDKLNEIVDKYMPDIIWQDFDLWRIDESYRLDFLSHYYNAGIDSCKEVVATYKDGFNDRGEVLDWERGGPGDITYPYWLTDDSISQWSWSYTENMGYYSIPSLIHAFLDRVSKNGNLLLNMCPMPNGAFPQQQRDILTAFGTFLRQMGTAVYNTRAWEVCCQGPTSMGGGSFQTPTEGTANDVRYTKSKDGDAVYAILLGWPGDGQQFTLSAVTTSRFDVGSGKVFLFGPTGGEAIELQFTQDGSGLRFTLPSPRPYEAVAYAIKISQSGAAPEPTPWIE
jgi:alpha-L-fucosidase